MTHRLSLVVWSYFILVLAGVENTVFPNELSECRLILQQVFSKFIVIRMIWNERGRDLVC
jgi:hypothetical protein